jgi:5-methylcytosine-specific restriction endonuclease McrA
MSEENKKCENCDNDHDGNYGSGRFCSNKCARGFSTKNKRQEINEKVSKKLLGYDDGLTKQQRIQQKIANKHASYIRETEITTLKQLSSRTVIKILKRMKLSCSNCNWFVDGAICDLHHIVERKNNGTDEHNNLCYICPNCHRLVHSGLIDSKKLINLHDYIGDEWKKYYYVKNSKIFKI